MLPTPPPTNSRMTARKIQRVLRWNQPMSPPNSTSPAKPGPASPRPCRFCCWRARRRRRRSSCRRSWVTRYPSTCRYAYRAGHLPMRRRCSAVPRRNPRRPSRVAVRARRRQSQWCPRQDSNLRNRLRRPVLYPLSYEGVCPSVRTRQNRTQLRNERSDANPGPSRTANGPIQPNEPKNSRRSSLNRSGCSIAEKCPPALASSYRTRW